MTCEILEGLEQGSPEWHAFRRTHRMASLAPAVMGVDPWTTKAEVVRHYRGEASKKSADAPPLRWGREHETDARQAAAQELGELLFPLVARRGEYAASLDGVEFGSDGNIRTVIECKAPYGKDESETFIGTLKGDIGHYRWQIQHQLMVTGADRALFYVWTPGPCALAWVRSDPVAQEQLRNAWDALMATVGAVDLRTDEAWMSAADLWRHRKLTLKQAEKDEAEAREDLLALVPEGVKESRGCGVIVTRSEVKGSVDYSKIPELQGVNLDAYRKPPTQRTTITEE